MDDEFFKRILRRYGGASAEAITEILCPQLIPIKSINTEILKMKGQSHYRALFEVEITPEISSLIHPGRTGKFIPKSFLEGSAWREITKGRILQINKDKTLALGEIYCGGNKRKDLEEALKELTVNDFLEIDQYGASAKILSGLVEYNLFKKGIDQGYVVRRMSEDCAKHISAHYHYDFEFEKNGVVKKIEVKSLWGTDTRYARLIRSKGKDHLTSSCKFETQDIFAVSLFLKTGNINDFAFAKSVSELVDPRHGLPTSTGFADYVHQNPVCEIGNGKWFASIDEVWEL